MTKKTESNKGWECPKCGKCYAPHGQGRKGCNPGPGVSGWTIGDPPIGEVTTYPGNILCHLPEGFIQYSGVDPVQV